MADTESVFRMKLHTYRTDALWGIRHYTVRMIMQLALLAVFRVFFADQWSQANVEFVALLFVAVAGNLWWGVVYGVVIRRSRRKIVQALGGIFMVTPIALAIDTTMRLTNGPTSGEGLLVIFGGCVMGSITGIMLAQQSKS
jgi:hypothetical protein